MHTSLRLLILGVALTACGCTDRNVIKSIPLADTYRVEFRICFPSSAFERKELSDDFVAPGNSITGNYLWAPEGTVETARILRASELVDESGTHYFLVSTKGQPTISWEIEVPLLNIETQWSDWLDPSNQYLAENVAYILVSGGIPMLAKPLRYAPMLRYRIKKYRDTDLSEDDPPPLPCPKPQYAR